MKSLLAIHRLIKRPFQMTQVLLGAILLCFAVNAFAQQPQLTLADLLIGLRSKKVTLEERNTLLAGAVKQRGITFSFTPEIEKELVATGASKELVDAVRERSQALAAAKPQPAPVPTPTPPDFNFYKTRADANLVKGDFLLALNDYDKAVSLKPDSSVAFLNRGRTHYGLKDFAKAGQDFDRSIELDPKDSKAYYNRGVLNESMGELQKAAADYQKAADLDPSNEPAKAMLQKVNDQLQAKAAAEKPQPPPVTTPAKPEPVPVKAPESINLGNLTAANAVRMVKPIYPQLAQRSNIEGRVVVEIQLDLEGNVVEAKAVSGHQFLRGAAEEAAKKSKFKPAMFGEQPVKGIASITYNFSLRVER